MAAQSPREPTTHQCRAWGRRAVTLKLKAETLLGDMIRALGTEHELTDAADNVVHQCEDLADNLSRYPAILKARRSILQEGQS